MQVGNEMKIVMLKPVKNLGKIGDIVEVKDGYGRNFLLPQNLATRATESNLIQFEERKHELEEANKAILTEAKKTAAKIEGKDFTFIRQCSDDGRLFGSVAAKEIAQVISSDSAPVHHSAVVLEHPIKTLGVFEVTIQAHVDVAVKVIVNIARSETEAVEAIKTFKNKDVAEEVSEETLEVAESEEEPKAKKTKKAAKEEADSEEDAA